MSYCTKEAPCAECLAVAAQEAPMRAAYKAIEKTKKAERALLDWIICWRSNEDISSEQDALYAVRDASDAYHEAVHAEALAWDAAR